MKDEALTPGEFCVGDGWRSPLSLRERGLPEGSGVRADCFVGRWLAALALPPRNDRVV